MDGPEYHNLLIVGNILYVLPLYCHNHYNLEFCDIWIHAIVSGCKTLEKFFKGSLLGWLLIMHLLSYRHHLKIVEILNSWCH